MLGTILIVVGAVSLLMAFRFSVLLKSLLTGATKETGSPRLFCCVMCSKIKTIIVDSDQCYSRNFQLYFSHVM